MAHRRTALALLFVCTFAVAAPTRAEAQAPPPPMPGHEPAPARAETVSITISPVHLILPLVEVMAELKAGPRISIAGILAGGSISADRVGGSSSESFKAYEAGAQFRYYATGSFAGGVQVGVEALYIEISTEDRIETEQAQGLAVGPFVGWKRIWPSGFTLDLQGGVQYMVIQGDEDDEDASDAIPLLNINLGWSF